MKINTLFIIACSLLFCSLASAETTTCPQLTVAHCYKLPTKSYGIWEVSKDAYPSNWLQAGTDLGYQYAGTCDPAQPDINLTFIAATTNGLVPGLNGKMQCGYKNSTSPYKFFPLEVVVYSSDYNPAQGGNWQSDNICRSNSVGDCPIQSTDSSVKQII